MTDTAAKTAESSINTVYVGNLGNEVTEDELKAMFKDCGAIKEVRVIKNYAQRPKGFAYVEFETKESAQKAMKTVNGSKFKNNEVKVDQAGEPRKIRNPNEPNPPCPTVYIGNLSFECKEADLRKVFGTFGNLKSVRVITNPATGKCRGYAYIEYTTVDEAKKALSQNTQTILERAIKVDYAAPPNTRVRRTRPSFRGGRGGARGGRGRGAARTGAPRRPQHEEEELAIPLDSKSVFVGSLPPQITPEALHQALSNCGTVVNIQMATMDNRPRGFAYVHFTNETEARRAIAQDGKINLLGRNLRIEEARTQKERVPRAPRPRAQGPPSTTVHVAGIPRTMNVEEVTAALRTKFGTSGIITEVNPIVANEKFLGYAYIVFNSIESAQAALAQDRSELNGRNLRVSFALPESERRPPRAPRENGPRGRGRGGRGRGRGGRGRGRGQSEQPVQA